MRAKKFILLTLNQVVHRVTTRPERIQYWRLWQEIPCLHCRKIQLKKHGISLLPSLDKIIISLGWFTAPGLSKVKSNYFMHAMKACGRLEIHPGTSASRPGRFTSVASPPVPLHYEAEWALEPVWRLRSKYKRHAIAGNRNTNSRSPLP